MKYIYPAIITQEEDGVLAYFPDIEGTNTDGATIEEALNNAEDVLNLMLMTMEDESMEIKKPTAISDLEVPTGATVSLVRADTLAYRRKVDTKAVRKSVSVPAWMDSLVKKNNLNLSNLLQNAIRKELNLA